MHRHHGDHGRTKKFFVSTDVDGDWEQPMSKQGRANGRRVRHKPYARHSRSKRIDWLEDFDNETT